MVAGVQRAEIIGAASENFVAHVSWLQERTEGMVVRKSNDIVITDSGLECDTFNVVCRARHPRIDEALAHCVRPFSWWVAPGDLPADLGTLLEERGLMNDESELAMFLPLDRLTASVSMRVERVRTREQLRAFAEINAANWSLPDENVLAFYRRASDAALRDDCPLRFYVGYVDHEPVASSELTLTGTTAGIYNVSTLRAYRRRGLGTAMTVWPLLEARREGATLGILQASEAGVSIYRRIGFEEYGEIREWRRSAD